MKVEREVLGQGRFLRLVRAGGWEHCERVQVRGVVILVALTDAGKVLFTEQHRPPVGRKVIEFPAGLAGDTHADDTLEAAAGRELIEETGYRARKLTLLTSGPTSAGLTNEDVAFFMATGLTKVGAGGGVAAEGESIHLHEVALPRAHSWLKARQADGLAIDPKIYAGLWFAEKALARRRR